MIYVCLCIIYISLPLPKKVSPSNFVKSFIRCFRGWVAMEIRVPGYKSLIDSVLFELEGGPEW